MPLLSVGTGYALPARLLVGGSVDVPLASATFRATAGLADYRVGLAQQYNSIAGQGSALGLIKEDQATIEGYVTQKALDGLYFMIGEQEKAFRANPLGASSDIVKKVFGAVR